MNYLFANRSKSKVDSFSKSMRPFILGLHKRNGLNSVRFMASRFGVTAANANSDFVGATDTRDVARRILHYGQHAFHALVLSILLSLVNLALVPHADATALGDAAAALSPGQWAQVTGMVNLSATGGAAAWGLSTPGPGFDGSQPAWDATAKKLYIETAEHGNIAAGDCANWPNFPHSCWKPLWTYDDASSTWTINGPFPATTQGGTTPVPGVHVWGGIAWDHTNKVIYVKQYDWTSGFLIQIFRYCASNSPASYCASQLNQWAPITPLNLNALGLGGEVIGQQMGWHPTLNGGTLLMFNSNSGCAHITGYTEGSGWRVIDNGAGCIYPNTNASNINAQYSTAKGLLIFGGAGGLRWYKINGAGTRTRLDDAPCAFYETSGGYSQAAEDPNTGNIYFIGCTPAGQLWKLDPTAGTGSQWTQISSALNGVGEICNIHRFGANVPPEPCGTDFYATPISTYGVIGFWKFRVGSPNFAEFWIYKPSVTGSDFTTRCERPGVIRCIPFDDSSEIANTLFGGNTGIDTAGASIPVIDTSVKASGNGSIKFTIPSLSAANTSGSYFANFSADLSQRFGANTTFYVQWRQRFSPELLNTVYWRNVSSASGETLTLSTNTVGTLRTATLSGTNFTSFTGMVGRNIYIAQFDPSQGSATITTVIDSRHASVTIDNAFSTTVYAGTWYNNFANAGGWKLASITTGDKPGCTTSSGANCFSSCTFLDIPVQNTEQRKFVQAYHSCGGSSSLQFSYGAFAEPDNDPIPGDSKLQQGRPSPECLYSQGPGAGFFPPTGNCFPFVANEWMTFKAKVTVGPRGGFGVAGASPNDEFVHSNFKLWAAREGQPSEMVINWNGYVGVSEPGAIFAAGDVSIDEKFGKIFLLPYHTEKSMYQIHSTATTWYDELIISTQDIADPGGSIPTPTLSAATFKIQ